MRRRPWSDADIHLCQVPGLRRIVGKREVGMHVCIGKCDVVDLHEVGLRGLLPSLSNREYAM